MKKLFIFLMSVVLFTSCIIQSSEGFDDQIKKEFPDASIYELRQTECSSKLLVITLDSTFVVTAESYSDSTFSYSTEKLSLIDSTMSAFPLKEVDKPSETISPW